MTCTVWPLIGLPWSPCSTRGRSIQSSFQTVFRTSPLECTAHSFSCTSQPKILRLNKLQEEKLAADGGRQSGDCQAPDLIRAGCALSCRRPGRLFRPPAMLLLAFLAHPPVKSRLRGQIAAIVSQFRHNLARRQRSVLRRIAHVQNLFALLFIKRMSWAGPARLRASIRQHLTPLSSSAGRCVR